MGRIRSVWSRVSSKGVRVLMLLGLLGLSGVVVGLAASYPLQFIDYEETTAVQVDQARLAGMVSPEEALLTQAELGTGWEPGDPALGAFGVLGAEFCGEQVATPTPLSERQTAVFTNSTNDTTVISQALRVDKWQSARSYVADVRDALEECSEFFQAGPTGRIKVKIQDASGTAPITDDYVSAAFVHEDGQSVQEWSMFAIGDVVVSVQHVGPTRPAKTFLNDVEDRLLARVDPKDFALGGIATDSTVPATTAADGSTETSVLDSGSADESGGDTGAVDDGGAAPTTAAPTTAPPTTARSNRATTTTTP